MSPHHWWDSSCAVGGGLVLHPATPRELVDSVLLVDERIEAVYVAEGREHIHRKQPAVPVPCRVRPGVDEELHRHRSLAKDECVVERGVVAGRERKEVRAHRVPGGPVEAAPVTGQDINVDQHAVRHRRQLVGHGDQDVARGLVAAVLLDRPPGVGEPRLAQGRYHRPFALGFENDRRQTGGHRKSLVDHLELENLVRVEASAELDLESCPVEPPPLSTRPVEPHRGDRHHRVEPEAEGGDAILAAPDRHRVVAAEEPAHRHDLEVEAVMEDIGLLGQWVVAALQPQILGLSCGTGDGGLGVRAALEHFDVRDRRSDLPHRQLPGKSKDQNTEKERHSPPTHRVRPASILSPISPARGCSRDQGETVRPPERGISFRSPTA